MNNCFDKYLVNGYFKTIILFSIVFRVSGKVRDFGSEGPELMKYIKKYSELTIDLTFTEKSWKGVEHNVLKSHVVNGVQNCLHMMVDKSDALNEITDIDSFKRDVSKAISEFKRV